MAGDASPAATQPALADSQLILRKRSTYCTDMDSPFWLGLLPFSWVVADWITVVRCRFSVSG